MPKKTFCLKGDVMLDSFFIVSEKGELIYAYQSEKSEIEEEKIVAFISALSSFGKDAFKEEMQVVRYKTKKLVLKPFTCLNGEIYIGVGLFEIIDDQQLCLKIITTIMSIFLKKCKVDDEIKQELLNKIREIHSRRTIQKRNLLLFLSIPIVLMGIYYSVFFFVQINNVWISLITLILSAFISGFLIGKKDTAAIIVLLTVVIFIISSFYLIDWIRYELHLEDYLMTVIPLSLFFSVVGAHFNEKTFLFPKLENLCFLYM
ncbi:MAG: hypothetical protein ACP6IS_10840 [Candidatus Asgardarchaeia archaeon]